MEINDNAIPDRIRTLIAIMEMCDPDVHEHTVHIRYYTELLLKAVREHGPDPTITDEQIEKIVIACALQDLGKITVPDEILNKESTLTPQEQEIYMRHTVRGGDILDTLTECEDQELLMYCKQICRYHHERYDGSGAPNGLKGEEIPFAARVVSVAEVYDLLTTDHFYRKRSRPTEAYHMIISGRAGSFSPEIIRCMQYVQDEMLEYAFSENIRKDQVTNKDGSKS
ncbi:MAG: HD domain-containing protein [Lachnospiraceae bacterium]|nr:HD domain-containing protein [Lachnospiraceae bacterium]